MPYVAGDRLILRRDETLGSHTFPLGSLAMVRDGFGGPGMVRSYLVEVRTVSGDATLTVELSESVVDEIFVRWNLLPGIPLIAPIPVLDQAQVGSTTARSSDVDVFLGPTADFPLPAFLHVQDGVGVMVEQPAPLPMQLTSSVRTHTPRDLLEDEIVEVDRGQFRVQPQVVRHGPYVLGEILVRMGAFGVQQWAVIRGSFGQEVGPPTSYTLKLVRDSSGPMNGPTFVVTSEQLDQEGWRRLPFERGTPLRRRLDGYPAQVERIYGDGRVVLLAFHAVTDDPISITVWFDDLDDSWLRVFDEEPVAVQQHAPRKTAWEWLNRDDV